MTIPKKRPYRAYLLLAGIFLSISTFVVSAGTLSVQALVVPSLPDILNQDKSVPSTDVSKDRNTNNNKNSESKTEKTVSIPVTTQTTPPTTVPPTTAAVPKAVTPSAPKTTVTTTRQVASQPVAPVTPATATIPDSSNQVIQVASAQASQDSPADSAQLYQSSKISVDERDQLYEVSLAVAAAGSVIYMLSYMRRVWNLAIGSSELSTSKIITE